MKKMKYEEARSANNKAKTKRIDDDGGDCNERQLINDDVNIRIEFRRMPNGEPMSANRMNNL